MSPASTTETQPLEASNGEVSRSPIVAEGLSKRYPSGVLAVDELGLSIGSGQVFGFLGPNGAGKTTAIKMMLGLITPTSGRVRLNGHDVHDERAEAVRQVGAVLEGARNVYWQLSAWNNLVYFGRLKGMATADARQQARWLLRELDLWDRRNEPVGEYSRGMAQKVAVAAALVADPPILLLDEPTLGLDVEAARTIRGWIRELADTYGKTIVLTSHQLDTVQELADRVGVIRDGRLIADLPTADLLARFRRDDHYRITVDGSLADVPLPPGFATHAENGTTTISGTVDSHRALYRLLDRLGEHDVSLRAVTSHEPDLEDVFVELVNSRTAYQDG